MSKPIQQAHKENTQPQEELVTLEEAVIATYDLQEWTAVANEIAQIKSSIKRRALWGVAVTGFGLLIVALGVSSDNIMHFGGFIAAIGAYLLNTSFNRYMALNEALQKYAKMKQMQDRVLSRW